MTNTSSDSNRRMELFGKTLMIMGAAFAISPFASSATALTLGILIAVIFGNPYMAFTKKLTPHLLSISVVGLGFGANLLIVGRVGLHGIGYTVLGIAFAFIVGTLLGRLLKTSRDVSLLITVGTAICGGSAIAAVSSVIKAKSHEVSVALVTIFLLNALALVIFPPIGHALGFSQTQFGLWAALAIHDTSSVVGASLQYGAQALEIGTTVKLARALWIVPVALTIGFMRARESAETGKGQFKKPWFILGFILAAAIATWLPGSAPIAHFLEAVAKQLLVLTLFLIGAGLTREALKSAGLRPLVQGVALWLCVSLVTVIAIQQGWISL